MNRAEFFLAQFDPDAFFRADLSNQYWFSFGMFCLNHGHYDIADTTTSLRWSTALLTISVFSP